MKMQMICMRPQNDTLLVSQRMTKSESTHYLLTALRTVASVIRDAILRMQFAIMMGACIAGALSTPKVD